VLQNNNNDDDDDNNNNSNNNNNNNNNMMYQCHIGGSGISNSRYYGYQLSNRNNAAFVVTTSLN